MKVQCACGGERCTHHGRSVECADAVVAYLRDTYPPHDVAPLCARCAAAATHREWEFHGPTVAELKRQMASFIQEAIGLSWGDVKMEYLHCDASGVVAAVFTATAPTKKYYLPGRWFFALEFTQEEDGSWVTAGGYSTQDRYCMGERYRGLWGPHEKEVMG